MLRESRDGSTRANELSPSELDESFDDCETCLASIRAEVRRGKLSGRLAGESACRGREGKTSPDWRLPANGSGEPRSPLRRLLALRVDAAEL